MKDAKAAAADKEDKTDHPPTPHTSIHSTPRPTFRFVQGTAVKDAKAAAAANKEDKAAAAASKAAVSALLKLKEELSKAEEA